MNTPPGARPAAPPDGHPTPTRWSPAASTTRSSPPRPELDAEVASETPRHEIEEAAVARVDLRVSRHLGFQEERWVVEFGHHHDRPRRLPLLGLRRDGRDRRDDAMETGPRVGPGLEKDRLSDTHVGDGL